MKSLASDLTGKAVAAGALLAGWLLCFPAMAGSYTQLHIFSGGADGADPEAGLTADAAGNLYGTTFQGANICSSSPYDGCGTIYKISSAGIFSTIYTFASGADGGAPMAGLTYSRGVLFGGADGGTTSAGTLFVVEPDGSDFTVLHQFKGPDGYQPTGFLQKSAAGGFYGITSSGGSTYTSQFLGVGVIFFVKADGTFKTLQSLPGGKGGSYPDSLLIDPAGDLFGSTLEGGDCSVRTGCGVVFEYVPSTHVYTVIHTFDGATDGQTPMLGGIGTDGTLYGATRTGGEHNHGTLFALAPSGGSYAFSVLAAFKSHEQGDGPTSPPTLASDGALVGGTQSFLYIYRNSKLSTLVSYGSTVPISQPNQLLIGPGSVLYGTSSSGGVTPCVFSNGEQSIYGCGSIFAYGPTPVADNR